MMPGYTDFDTWFHEREGVSLRSERFNGDVEWLKAAFDAGRSAQHSISTGQGEAVKLTGGEIWEWLFGELRGDVPEGLTDDVLDRLAAHIKTHFLTQSHPSLPAGHVAVPVEPTVAMVEAFMAEMGAQGVAMDDFSEPIYPAKLYRAMLAALPHNQGEGK